MLQSLLDRHPLFWREPVTSRTKPKVKSISDPKVPGRKAAEFDPCIRVDSRQASLQEIHSCRSRFRTDIPEMLLRSERKISLCDDERWINVRDDVEMSGCREEQLTT